MNKEPHVSKYLDDEERDLIESEDCVPESVKTPKMISEHESFARIRPSVFIVGTGNE